MHLSQGLRYFVKGLHGPVSWVIKSNLLAEHGCWYCLQGAQKAWGRVEVTAQSWLSSPNGLCVCTHVCTRVCFLSLSPKGKHQGLMQERAQHGCDVPESGEVGNQDTSFVGNL